MMMSDDHGTLNGLDVLHLCIDIVSLHPKSFHPTSLHPCMSLHPSLLCG